MEKEGSHTISGDPRYGRISGCQHHCRVIQPRARRRTMQPGADELRMYSESHRQMEMVWAKIFGGSVIGGAVLVGGPTAGAAILRFIRLRPGPVLAPAY